jgi:hypothetical protein
MCSCQQVLLTAQMAAVLCVTIVFFARTEQGADSQNIYEEDI